MGKSTSNREQIDKIASELGLSRSAVYFALAGTGKVSSATRARVHRLAQELGYQPNSNARALRTRRTNLIGVILTSPNSDLYDDIIRALTAAVADTRYQLLFTYSYSSPAEERDLLRRFTMMDVDGILIQTLCAEENRTAYQQAGQTTPLVFMDAPLLDHFDSVCVDNYAVGYQAGCYLWQRGLRRLAYLHPDPKYGRGDWWNLERYRGFAHALREAGGVTPVELGLTIPAAAIEQAPVLCQDDLSLKWSPHSRFALRVVEEELSRIHALDGMFTANDELAHGVIKGLAASGVRVPEDVSVIGCDNRQTDDFFSPPLTSLRQPLAEIGTQSMRLLLQRIQQAETPLPPQQLLLPPTIITRASCGEQTVLATG